MARPTKFRKPVKLLEVQDWLREFVSQGPQVAEKIRTCGETLGYKYRTLLRAKESLGLHSKKRGYPAVWYWSLEKDPAFPATPDAEADALASKKISAWRGNITDPPRTKGDIKTMTAERLHKMLWLVGEADITFKTLAQQVIEEVRLYDKPEAEPPIDDERIIEFIVETIGETILDENMSVKDQERLQGLLAQSRLKQEPTVQLDPAIMERVNALSTVEEVDAWLAELADLGIPTKIAEVLKNKRAQLTNAF